MKIRTQTLATITIVSVLAFGLSACSEAKSDIKAEEEIVAIPVIAESVAIGDIDATYGTTTSLEAAEEAAVAARVSGVVTEIFVEEGDYVVEGQILAQQEVDKLTLEVQRATANLNQLKNDLKRNKKIYDKNLISSEAYDKVRYQYQAQKAETDLAKLNLDYATIRAPISGVIAVRYIKEGNLLKTNASAFHISDLSEIHGVIHIPESEKAGLAVGQLARVKVEASEYPFIGSIKRISPVVDRDSGTIRVTVSLKDKTRVLRPGMFGRVSVVYDTHNQTMLVPKDSILSEDDEISVYVVKDGVAFKNSVSIGYSDSDYVEILSGVEATDLVITTGQRNLRNETTVELINKVATL